MTVSGETLSFSLLITVITTPPFIPVSSRCYGRPTSYRPFNLILDTLRAIHFTFFILTTTLHFSHLIDSWQPRSSHHNHELHLHIPFSLQLSSIPHMYSSITRSSNAAGLDVVGGGFLLCLCKSFLVTLSRREPMIPMIPMAE